MDPYREHILDHYRRPRNFGALEAADVVHRELNPTCGDSFELYLQFEDDRLAQLTFTGSGCAISTAGASILTLLVAGKTRTELAAFRDRDLLDELGVELSPARTKCGLLALAGLRRGLQTRS